MHVPLREYSNVAPLTLSNISSSHSISSARIALPYWFIYTRMPEFTRTPHKAVAELKIFRIFQAVNSAKCGINIEISKLCNALQWPCVSVVSMGDRGTGLLSVDQLRDSFHDNRLKSW